LAFVAHVLSLPAGVPLAVIVGLVRKQPTMAVVGAALIVAFVALHLTRARRGTKELVEEIARNPFKPKRVPKYPDSGLLG